MASFEIWSGLLWFETLIVVGQTNTRVQSLPVLATSKSTDHRNYPLPVFAFFLSLELPCPMIPL